MVTVNVVVLAGLLSDSPEVRAMPSYHTHLFLCLAHIAAHVRDGGMVHAQMFENSNTWLDSRCAASPR